MNYQKCYDALVARAYGRQKGKGVYLEKHHIHPTCLGGPDVTSNIAYLTPEEHYLAHQLLVKIYPDNLSLARAVIFMSTDPYGHRVNNKAFGWVKRHLAQKMSEREVTDETRKRISLAATGKPHPNSGWCDEAKQKKSASMMGSGNNRYGIKQSAETIAKRVATRARNRAQREGQK